ncbi:unnamed protein product [Caenorhabditis angaria]|uniref:Acid phosphatase n=1 Tax=Caenorhabditis angaria TaxID=860376 RepID=A0A9P1ICL9_9PELO|nr:unnamed protein product [Caenorhabditis angaria]
MRTLLFLYFIKILKSELVLVETIWRHGDRSPTAKINAISKNESDWIFGGGGLGELTTIGMKEQFILGQKMKKRYIESGFLHKFYDSKQIHIRSTDKNRTLVSAMANMLGMFSSGGRPGIDYPEIDGWPRGYMPVPIHAPEESENDCLLNSLCKCKRSDKLLEEAKKGEEYQQFISSSKYIEVCKNLSILTNEHINADNLWKIEDILISQRANFPNSTELIDEKLYKAYRKELLMTNKFLIGIYDPEIINGINIRDELLKLRAGLLINDIVKRMRSIADCYSNNSKCDEKLKYYAYSSHDHTLMSLLSILHLENVITAKEKIYEGEWPDYSADITFELYLNNSTASFKIFYLQNTDSDFEDVTNQIAGCEGSEFCDLEIIEEIALKYLPPKEIEEFCEIPPGLELFSPKMQALSKNSNKFHAFLFFSYFSILIVIFVK